MCEGHREVNGAVDYPANEVGSLNWRQLEVRLVVQDSWKWNLLSKAVIGKLIKDSQKGDWLSHSWTCLLGIVRTWAWLSKTFRNEIFVSALGPSCIHEFVRLCCTFLLSKFYGNGAKSKARHLIVWFWYYLVANTRVNAPPKDPTRTNST